MSLDLTRTASSKRPIPRRPQLSEDVAGRIRQQIVTGVLQPGSFVRIEEAAVELGVSATPVREALVALRGEGLVEQVPHRGYRVNELSAQDVDDIFWLQGTIAGTLAGRAAGVITDEHVAQLTALNDGLRDAVARADAESVEYYEFEFHKCVNKVAGGMKLAWFLLGAVRYTPRLYATDARWGEDAVRSHEQLIDAFERRDIEAAADVMRRQFRKWDIR
ncbi:GntR family transcriptional regulator [Rhodococcus ruber]|uniref:GntR family transcriptional regulator n=1 Tax=Rhodococcus ruber TaxID=1830 RepID=A0ABT4MG95_9NOCA|nr:GntR family transcriptional regulator [Rhodococcus ruber]MCZ4520007.1 GntR family transcriptional regulator [Rhodococcus ruber]